MRDLTLIRRGGSEPGAAALVDSMGSRRRAMYPVLPMSALSHEADILASFAIVRFTPESRHSNA